MASQRVEKETTVKRDPQSRSLLARSRPYAAVLLVALFVIPAFCIVLRTFVWVDDSLTWWIVWAVLLLFGSAVPAAAVGVGYKVTKRTPFVIWHVAVTLHLFAAAASLSVLPGWEHDRAGTGPLDAVWWKSITDVFTLPAGYVLAYLLGALAVAMTWWLYRFDALRTAAGAGGERDSGLAELLKFPTGATVRRGSIEADEHAITATIDHPGVPVKQIQDALPAMVEQAGAVRGRSTVIPGDRGGESKVRIVKSDPLKKWLPWPGLSHPGGSFAYPIRTAYYVNGTPQWYSFARTPKPGVLPPSRLAPKFRSSNDAHVGRQGTTRSGKSGDNSIEVAEIASRRDAILCFANAAKLMQDVGWAIEFASLAADTKPKAVILFDKIRSLGEYRSAVMGDPRLEGRHRTWSPRTYEELGFAAIVVEVDEGDQLLNGSIATWLATKGLSLGIFMSTMISRAATDGMASTLRSAIVQWKAFGAGQAYDAGFVLTDETIAAGADVGSLSTKFPGSHYADRLNGVDETMYPELARSYQTAEDFSDLKRAVNAARATFTPAGFTDGERRVLGEALDVLSPRAILIGAYAKADGLPAGTATALPATTSTEGNTMTDMQSTLDLESGDRAGDTGDPEVDAILSRPRPNFDDLQRQYGELPPPGENLPSRANPNLPDVTLEDGRPERSEADTAAEFDAAMIRLAGRGVSEFANADVLAEMRCDPKPSFVSRRFKAICDDHKPITPPGLVIERIPGKAGRYLLTRLMPEGAGAGGTHSQ